MQHHQQTTMDHGLAASPLLVLTLVALCSLIAYNAFALWTWLRTAWILRKLPNGSGNLIYGGLSKVLAFNRMREVQKMNEGVLQGAGACFFNVLWRQVSITNAKCCDYLLASLPLPQPPLLPKLVVDSRTACVATQFVVVTDPVWIAQLIHDKSLHKPVEPDYAHFRQV